MAENSTQEGSQAMFTESHTITVTKLTKRSLREGKAEADQAKMVAAVNSRSQEVGGWVVTAGQVTRVDSTSTDYEYQYSYVLLVDYNKAVEADSTTLDNIVRKVAAKAPQPQYNRWTLSLVDDDSYEPKQQGESEEDAEEVGYAPCAMPDDFESYFGHLYGLDDQVLMVKSAVESAIGSGWYHRNHVVLWGSPGCGKSEVALALKSALGEEAVWSFDGVAITQAGVTKMFAEAEVLPRVVVIEEIEKAAEEPLRGLLAMLDTRGEIRKVTARGAIQRDTKVLCIATVNDKDYFDRMLKEALSDRFTTPVYFERPSREVLTMILKREIDRVGGDYAWVDPTLDFCEAEGITAPRRAIAICMGGRDLLLTGQYQQVLRNTSGPKVKKGV